jgi:hypothetical protein
VIAGAEQRARELIVFCDGFDEAGVVPGFTCRARSVARDVRELGEALAAERSARVALQARCERQQEILGRRVLDAIEARA